MKKIISSLLALAMFVAVGVTMVGCDNVSGKEYELTGTTVTVVTKITEEGKIEETKTFTMDEYAKLMYVWTLDPAKSIEDALKYELKDNEAEAFAEMKEDMFGDEYKVSMTFKNGTVTSVQSEEDEGAVWESVREGTYTIEEDTVYLTRLDFDNVYSKYGFEDYQMYIHNTTTMKITEDGALVNREVFAEEYNDEEYVYTEEDVFSATNFQTFLYMEMIFTEVK